MNPQKNLAAIGFMLAATAFIAATTVFAKMLGAGPNGLHPVQITQGRFLFALIGFSAAAAVIWPRFTRPNLKLHALRSLAGFAGVTLMFTAVQLVPLADATALTFTNPIFAMILAIPILGERVGPWRWVAAGAAFAGALILIRPGAGSFEIGALVALGAAALMGTEITLLKLLTGREKVFQILLLNNTFGLVFSTLAASLVWQGPTQAQWALLAALGLTMATAQVFFIQAMRRGEASFVVLFSYATLIFATVYDLVLFDVVPDALSGLGAAVILTGGLLLAWRESRPGRPA